MPLGVHRMVTSGPPRPRHSCDDAPACPAFGPGRATRRWVRVSIVNGTRTADRVAAGTAKFTAKRVRCLRGRGDSSLDHVPHTRQPGGRPCHAPPPCKVVRPASRSSPAATSSPSSDSVMEYRLGGESEDANCSTICRAVPNRGTGGEADRPQRPPARAELPGRGSRRVQPSSGHDHIPLPDGPWTSHGVTSTASPRSGRATSGPHRTPPLWIPAAWSGWRSSAPSGWQQPPRCRGPARGTGCPEPGTD